MQSKRKEYVVGFLLNHDCRWLAMIEKKRPAWQAGLLNGIGGKVEPDEFPADAMAREAKEETGVEPAWTHYVTLRYPDALIHFFWASDQRAYGDAKAMTDEKIRRVAVAEIAEADSRVVPNLRFLVPMAVHAASHETIVPVIIDITGASDTVSTPKPAPPEWHGTYLTEDEIVADVLAIIEARGRADVWRDAASWRMPFGPGGEPLDEYPKHAGSLMCVGMDIRNWYGLWHPECPHTIIDGPELVIEDGVITDPRHPDNVSARIIDRVRATLAREAAA